MKAILIASIAVSLASVALAAADTSYAAAPLPDWDEAPDEFKKGVEAQVAAYAADPELTPQAVYGAWLDQKQADGWTFGEKLDTDKKQSPSIVPWSQAPLQRRVIETMLHACANRLKALPDEAQVQIGARPSVESVTGREAAPQAFITTPDGHVLVKYIGHRETYKDGAYGSGIVFAKGETKAVPVALAAQLLRHKDVYGPGDTTAPVAPPAVVTKLTGKETEEDRVQDTRDAINGMRSKAAVAEFVKNNYQQDLDTSKPLADLKLQAVQLVDQFGIAQ